MSGPPRSARSWASSPRRCGSCTCGASSANVVAAPAPEFYIRLSAEERFGIVKLGTKKESRVVQRWSLIPVSKEIVDEMACCIRCADGTPGRVVVEGVARPCPLCEASGVMPCFSMAVVVTMARHLDILSSSENRERERWSQ